MKKIKVVSNTKDSITVSWTENHHVKNIRASSTDRYTKVKQWQEEFRDRFVTKSHLGFDRWSLFGQPEECKHGCGPKTIASICPKHHTFNDVEKLLQPSSTEKERSLKCVHGCATEVGCYLTPTEKEDKVGWEDWHSYWNKESQYCEQKYLTPDTHGIIKDFIRTQIEQAEQRGYEKAIKDTFKSDMTMFNNVHNSAIDKAMQELEDLGLSEWFLVENTILTLKK